MGNCERYILSSVDAVDIFMKQFDAQEMDYRLNIFLNSYIL